MLGSRISERTLILDIDSITEACADDFIPSDRILQKLPQDKSYKECVTSRDLRKLFDKLVFE